MPDEPLTQEKILKDCSRMSLDDTFRFSCAKSLDCFTNCCADVSIVLTPYDVLRLKNALGITSSEFLDKYTVSPFTKEQKIPVVILKMDPESKRCPFVDENGCKLYSDRPWACRMYPLGVAEPQKPNPNDHKFHFLVKDVICHGHQSDEQQTVRSWTENQGIEEYEAMGVSFRDLMLSEFWDKTDALTPEQIDMYYMSCYDIDRFRRFIFETRFLTVFEVDEARIEAMRTDEMELLEFAMQWLRFTLFKEKSMKIRPDAKPRRERPEVAQ